MDQSPEKLNNMERLLIWAFRAVDEPQLAAEYMLEHERVLTDIGVSASIANNQHWLKDPSVHLIAAIHPTLGMVAGIRVQPSKLGQPLPMEESILPLDASIRDVLRFLGNGSTAEICGLWNAHRFAGRGVPLLLSMAAVSLTSQLNLRTMVCFVAHYTQRHARRVGFRALESVGNKGVFTYPIPSIRSIAMVIPDTVTLASAEESMRQAILSLRVRPLQARLENPAGIDLDVKYLLQLDNAHVDMALYGRIQRDRHRFTA